MAALFLNPNGNQITIEQIVDAGQLGRALLALDSVNPGNVIAANTSDGSVCTASDSLQTSGAGKSLLQCSAPEGFSYLMMYSGYNVQFQQAGPSATHYAGQLTIENGVIVQLT